MVGYPALIEDPTRWVGIAQAIDVCNGVRRDDAARIRRWAGLLNSEIGAAVSDIDREAPNGVHLRIVNVQDGAGGDRSSADLFEPSGSRDRHNLCGTHPWMNGLQPSKGFRPTLEAHLHIGKLVAAVLEGNAPAQVPITTVTATEPPVTVTQAPVTTARASTSGAPLCRDWMQMTVRTPTPR